MKRATVEVLELYTRLGAVSVSYASAAVVVAGLDSVQGVSHRPAKRRYTIK